MALGIWLLVRSFDDPSKPSVQATGTGQVQQPGPSVGAAPNGECPKDLKAHRQTRLVLRVHFLTPVGPASHSTVDSAIDLDRARNLFQSLGVQLDYRFSASPTDVAWGALPANVDPLEQRKYGEIIKQHAHPGHFAQVPPEQPASASGTNPTKVDIYVTLAGTPTKNFLEPLEAGKSDSTDFAGYSPLFGFYTDSGELVAEDRLPRNDAIIFLGNIWRRVPDDKSRRAMATRTFAHELSHLLNITHHDAVRAKKTADSFPYYSIEHVTISDADPIWEWTVGSIQHLMASAITFVAPGAGNKPFIEDVRTYRPCEPQPNPRRVDPSDGEAQVVFPNDPQPWTPDASTLALRIDPLPMVAPKGSPVAAELRLTNNGGETVKVPKQWGRLGGGWLRIDVKELGGTTNRLSGIANLQELANLDEFTELHPGATLRSKVDLSVSQSGQVFLEVGQYTLRVALVDKATQAAVLSASNVAVVDIVEPRADKDVGAAAMLEDAGRKWEYALSFALGPLDEEIAAVFRDLGIKYPGTALGNAANRSLEATSSGGTPVSRCVNQVSRVADDALTRFLLEDVQRSQVSTPQPPWAISFETGSSVIDAASINRIRASIRESKLTVRHAIVIEGHTDIRGGCTMNQRLSRERAEAVARIVRSTLRESRDAAARQIRVLSLGWGYTRPKNSQDSEDAWKTNRRVEVTVL
ncbi:OmpA family protein [Mitsuaria sp. TWR114]|nr:OmpA family protein [Mitsuaria sp. TWR114]